MLMRFTEPRLYTRVMDGNHSLDYLRARPSRRSTGQDKCELVFCVRRSEEHTSELQSLAYLVCRLLLEKKKQEQGRPSLHELLAPRRGTWATCAQVGPGWALVHNLRSMGEFRLVRTPPQLFLMFSLGAR